MGADSDREAAGVSRARVVGADIAAGYIGGCAKYIAFHSLDTLSTILEADRSSTSLPRALARLVQDGGVQALFAGLPTTLALGFPYAAIYHTAFATVRDGVADAHEPLRGGGAAAAIAAAAAAACGAVVGVPSECLKHRLQVGQYRSVPDALRRTVGAGAWRELYAGLSSTLLRNVPYNALQFGTFAALQRAYGGVRRRPTTSAEDAAIGTAAGLVTAIGTNPIDVVNTRLQVYPAGAGGAGGVQYGGVRDAFSRIVREEGPSALFKGVVPRVAAWAPSGALFFAVYERTRRAILRGGPRGGGPRAQLGPRRRRRPCAGAGPPLGPLSLARA